MRHGSVRLFAVASVALFLAAAPLAQKPEMTGYPASGAEPIITVLKPGSAPRAQLRYAIAADTKLGLVITAASSVAITSTIGQVAQKQQATMPTMSANVDLAITDVASNGDLAYDVIFSSVRLEPTPGVTPNSMKGLQPFAERASTIKAAATISNRGIVRALRMDVPHPEMETVLEGVISATEHLPIPLPDEAIGVGARWDVREARAYNGPNNLRATLFQRTEYEVLSIDGRSVSLKVKVEHTAPPQLLERLSPPLVNQGIVFGAENHLQKVSGSGTGQALLRIDSLVPASRSESSISISYTTSMTSTDATMSTNGTMAVDRKTRVTIAAR